MKPRDIIRLAQRNAAEILREAAEQNEPPDELFDNDSPQENDWQVERWRTALRDLADKLEPKQRKRR